ncbi:MAG: asparagine synthase (glutamine-hydrolyzing), partial [Lactobacillus crispatus]|nr:asparagine synthase (glutamine-hydrolyzing) [Lactobacillus crispatus]
MCGIVAFYDPKINEKQAVIGKMMATIKHRGPNSDGYYTNDEVALGFRRLSIIDLRGGAQPIYNEDKTRAIIFNGEIYNFKPLREQLIKAGHTFTTKADTEVLLHGYEEWGMDGLLKKVRGMFAFLIWDDNNKTLYGARDFFGIKPMYYSNQDGHLLVGSELKSFLEYPKFKRELNVEAVKPYLMNQYNDLEETFFKGVYRFPAGHWFEYKDGEMKTHQYWDAEYKENSLSFEETLKRINDDLKETVDLYRIADVKVGAFLSEGIDSSYLTTLLNPDDVFSVSFDDSTYDEASKAKALADINHWKFYSDKVDADEAMRDFPEMQYHMDEPDANPSIIPLWYLCKLARKHVTVALSGEGADELFAGYVNYGMHTHNDIIKVFTSELKKLPEKKRVKLAHKIKRMPNFPGKVHMYTNLAEPSEFYVGQSVIYDMDYPTIFTSKDANSILQPTYRNKLTVNGIYQKDFKKVKG